MPTLYHHPMSSSSRFVRLILSEYGFQTDLVEEQPWEKRREFLTLNPAGTLPVYVDDNMRNIPDHYHAHARWRGRFLGQTPPRRT